MNSIFDIHADDYALSENSDNDILELCSGGVLDSISVLPNLECFEKAAKRFLEIQQCLSKKILVSVHLNFMEGKCCAKKELVPNLVDKDGFFRVSWGKLFLWNYLPFFRAKIKKQLKLEISEQIKKCVSFGFCEKEALRIDSHQHPHMIPLVFEALKDSLTELEEEGFKAQYIRNTQDPIAIYGGKYIFSMNTVKCLILNFYSKKVRKYLASKNLSASYLCGVYFSGKMDDRIKDIFPKFVELSKKSGRKVEMLFHSGTMLECELTEEFKKEGFNEFHLSKNRKIEYETVKNILREIL